jgi:chemotaxis protein MotB
MEGTNLVKMFEETGGDWIVTYADMMTLILVFFILLYTLADYEDKAYRAQIAAVNVMDGDGNLVNIIDYASRSGGDPEPLAVIEDLLGLNPSQNVIDTMRPKIFTELESMLNSTDMDEAIALESKGDRINLNIDGRLLFASGKAELNDSAVLIFRNLAQLFQENSEYSITIRGHTDDLSINTVQFPSNWELSAVRATTVLRFFIQQGIDPERMSATGFADIIPLVPNDTPQNRARNRRVEFVLEKKTTD